MLTYKYIYGNHSYQKNQIEGRDPESGNRLFFNNTSIMSKEYKQSDLVTKLFPIFGNPKNPGFEKAAQGFAYTTEIVFTIVTVLVLIDLLVTNPSVLLVCNAFRAVILFIIAGLTMVSVYHGHSITVVNTYFYLAEYFIVVAVLSAGLIVDSIQLSQLQNAPGYVFSVWDLTSVLTFVALILFNGYYLTKELYRKIWLGKTVSPINSLMTLTNAIAIGVMASRRTYWYYNSATIK